MKSKQTISRVEFVGPMGAGKSTIANKVIEAVDEVVNTQIMSSRIGKQRILLRKAWETSFLHYLFLRSLILIPTLKYNLITNNITSYAWDVLEQNAAELASFINHALLNRSGIGVNSDHMLLRTWYFTRDLTDVLLLEKYSTTDVVLFDESLLQRGLSLAFGDSSGKEFLQRYSELVPLPDIVVQVTGDPKVLAERIRLRGRAVSRLTESIEEACYLSHLVAGTCRDRGAVVIELNGMASLEENVKKCLIEIKALLKRRNE